MSNFLISVVVAVYNSEKYLDRCVSSIRAQSYQNLEILLVDDGSTDASADICERFAEQDERIRVIHQENAGASCARNAGLDAAHGDLITFVDSDDWLTADIYRVCVETIVKEMADVVDFQPEYAYGASNSGIPAASRYRGLYQVLEGEEIIHDYLLRGQTDTAPFTMWRKVYASSLFQNVRFPAGMTSEDIITNFLVLKKAHRLVHTGTLGYLYFQNNGSVTKSPLKAQDLDLLKVSRLLYELSDEFEDKRILQLAKVKLARSYFSLLAKAARYGIDSSVDDPDRLIRFLTSRLRANFGLLMKAPVPLSRKCMIAALCVNFHCLALPVHCVDRVTRNFRRG